MRTLFAYINICVLQFSDLCGVAIAFNLQSFVNVDFYLLP